MNYNELNLPEVLNELKSVKQWVVFELSNRSEDGKWNKKLPKNPNTGRNASSNQSTTWGTYDQAVTSLKAFRAENKDGIKYALGFALGCNSHVGGIDGDHCLKSDGSLNDNATNIINKANSYTESSISGIGFHILVLSHSDYCTKSDVDKGEEGYETYTPRFYTEEERKALLDAELQKSKPKFRLLENAPDVCNGRFFIITGKTIGEPKPIIEGTATIDYVYNEYIKPTQIKPTKAKRGRPSKKQAADDGVKKISRHDTMLTYANKLWWDAYNFAIPELDILRLYKAKAVELDIYSDGKYDEPEVLRWFNDSKNHVKSELEKTPLKPKIFSDLGQAEVFKKENGSVFRIAGKLNSREIYHFDGIRWCSDSDNNILEAFQELAKNQYWESLKDGNDDNREDYINHALQYQDTNHIKNAIVALQPSVAIKCEEFDSDPYILNTPDGIIDLRTGAIRKQTPNDYCLKITGCSMDDKGKEFFENYLAQFTNNDKDVQNFLQLIMGATAIGESFSKAIILHSKMGGTGKSTYLEFMSLVMGDYANPMARSIILKKSNDGDKLDALSKLEGVRFAYVSELPKNAELDPLGLKTIASQDKITSRAKYKNTNSFKPTHLPIIATNDIPSTVLQDDSVMDRLIIIPFFHKFRIPGIDIRNYHKVLFTECGGYALRWIVEGAKKFIANGCEFDKWPSVVTNATATYWKEGNQVQEFINDYCSNEPWEVDSITGEIIKDCQIKRTVLHDWYIYDYCVKYNIRDRLSPNKFYTELENLGYKQITSNGKFFVGIQMNEFYRNKQAKLYIKNDELDSNGETKKVEADIASMSESQRIEHNEQIALHARLCALNS